MLLSTGRFGRPKLTLLTPSTVFTPSSSVRRFTVSSVTFAASASADTASVNASKTKSSFVKPYLAPSARIFSAIAIRPSLVAGIPDSSRQSPTIIPPYFLTSGKTASIDSRLPFTELTSALPFTWRSAISSALGSAVSICNGHVTTLSTAPIVLSSVAASSIPGTPQLTSSTFAPESTCVTASRRT